MCLYDPPPLLGLPDLSAAMICALPLAASATRWAELLSAFIGLAVGFLAAHFSIVALHHHYPPSLFYWMSKQAEVTPFNLAVIAYELILLYAASHFVRSLWRAEYRRAGIYLLLALALLAAVAGPVAYFVFEAHAFEALAAELSLINAASEPSPEIMIADCMFPPFGEGVTGYAMLGVLVIFEILVAVGIANALNSNLTLSAQEER